MSEYYFGLDVAKRLDFNYDKPIEQAYKEWETMYVSYHGQLPKKADVLDYEEFLRQYKEFVDEGWINLLSPYINSDRSEHKYFVKYFLAWNAVKHKYTH